jgi:hypothetical protein
MKIRNIFCIEVSAGRVQNLAGCRLRARRHGDVGAPARRHAGDGGGGRPLPAMAQAAGGLFCQTFSEVVLFDNTLAQVV